MEFGGALTVTGSTSTAICESCKKIIECGVPLDILEFRGIPGSYNKKNFVAKGIEKTSSSD